jgi:hypothetical protein
MWILVGLYGLQFARTDPTPFAQTSLCPCGRQLRQRGHGLPLCGWRITEVAIYFYWFFTWTVQCKVVTDVDQAKVHARVCIHIQTSKFGLVSTLIPMQ